MEAGPIAESSLRVPRWVKRMLLLLAIWSVPGVILAASMYVVLALKRDEMSFLEALAWRVPGWWVWALATPLIVWLGRRYVLWRQPWKSIPIHLVANAAIATGEIAVFCLCSRWMDVEPYDREPILTMLPWVLLKSVFIEVVAYWAVIAADHGLAYQRRYRESALRQTQLEARLVEAQLDALKMQLHPHFLFNTINAITVLMRKGETACAIRMLGGLSELLRRSLSSLRVEFVALEDELDFIERYLDIETTRFPDRLRVSVDIEDRAQHARVPSLILQPIVENAIKHGIAPRVSGGQIDITARVIEDQVRAKTRTLPLLRIEVRDDGVGLGAAPRSEGHGLGLSHVRKRLAQLYGETHRFTLEPGAAGGTVAAIELPFEEVA